MKQVEPVTVEFEGNAYFRRMERKVFSLDESSGAFSGVAAAVEDMVSVSVVENATIRIRYS